MLNSFFKVSVFDQRDVYTLGVDVTLSATAKLPRFRREKVGKSGET